MIRRANLADIAEVMDIINDAKLFLARAGSNQWQGNDGYPNHDTMINDIKMKQLYLFSDNEIKGCLALVQGIEPSYGLVEGGAWSNNDCYLTVHRLAVRRIYHGQGIAQSLLQFAVQTARDLGIGSVRVDTKAINTPMNQLLQSMKFQKIGLIYLNNERSSEAERIAYEYIVH